MLTFLVAMYGLCIKVQLNENNANVCKTSINIFPVWLNNKDAIKMIKRNY